MGKKVFALGVVLITLSVFLGLSAGFAQEKVYINGFDADYPPFSFIGKDGKPAGFDIDALNLIANEMGFKVKHQPTDWAAIVPTLQAKKSTSRSGMVPPNARPRSISPHLIGRSYSFWW
jgi:polar amino acid transport system substrate-binding protein